MPEGDDTSRERTHKYHRKSNIEKHVADPLLAIAQAIERYVDTIATEHIRQTENQNRSDDAEERRHRNNIAVEKRATRWAAAISGATLLVLVATFCVYSRQATIMATQASIMNGQLSEMRAEQRPWLSENIPIVTDVLVNPNTGAGFGLRFRAHNVGHLTALSARLALEIYPKSANEIVDKQRAICSGDALTQNESLGTSIFPDESHEFKIAVGVLKSDWDSASVTFESKNGNITGISPVVYGCLSIALRKIRNLIQRSSPIVLAVESEPTNLMCTPCRSILWTFLWTKFDSRLGK
jgi:hypothetical protein